MSIKIVDLKTVELFSITNNGVIRSISFQYGLYNLSVNGKIVLRAGDYETLREIAIS